MIEGLRLQLSTDTEGMAVYRRMFWERARLDYDNLSSSDADDVLRWLNNGWMHMMPRGAVRLVGPKSVNMRSMRLDYGDYGDGYSDFKAIVEFLSDDLDEYVMWLAVNVQLLSNKVEQNLIKFYGRYVVRSDDGSFKFLEPGSM